jgi:hypothetical protein
MSLPSSMSLPNSFQPYGFLLNGGRRLSSGVSVTGSPEGSVGSRTPPCEPTECPWMVGFKPEHAFLSETCEFIVPPKLNPVEHETPTRARTLFIGQLKFETTPAEVRWIIHCLVGVTALKVDARGPGCFVAYLASEGDELAVRTLNRRVLMDHTGFWFARTQEGCDAMIDYVEKVLPRLGMGNKKRSLHLPRDCIVVEESRARRRKAGTPSISKEWLSATPNSQKFLANSPPSPYSLGSPALGSGFHHAVPDYVSQTASAPCPICRPTVRTEQLSDH